MAREQFEADSAGTHGEALSAASECGPSSSPSVGEDFHIVGIGASAGGLESLERLFAHLPTDTGMAFVVLQHLSPDFKSLMDELLSRRTQLRIRQAEHDMAVEPDTVYLLPPMKEMIIRQRRLLLNDRDPRHGLTLPIDLFLPLAGAGRRRARGRGRPVRQRQRRLARRPGRSARPAAWSSAESPDTAKFNGMPLSAMRTGVVDQVPATRGDRAARSPRSAADSGGKSAVRTGASDDDDPASTRSCGCCATSTGSTSRTTRPAPSRGASSAGWR